MSRLIFTHDHSIEPNGSIGIQKCGIIFWQKTDILRHCSERRLKSVVARLNQKVSFITSAMSDRTYCLQFDNDEEKLIYLTLKCEQAKKRLYLYGEAHTVYTDADFHILVLAVVDDIAKQMRCKFFVDDATGYLEHGSKQRLAQYIEKFDIQPPESEDLLRKAVIERQNRLLDIHEILSRETEQDVVADAYEYFMRKSNWEIDDRFPDAVKTFALCISYAWELETDGVLTFLSVDGRLAHQTADALHRIGARDAETVLRNIYSLFPNQTVPEDDESRSKILNQIDSDILFKLDREADNAGIEHLCYQYLMNHKADFIQ